MKSKIVYANLTYLQDVKIKTPQGTKVIQEEKVLHQRVFTEGKTEYYIKETKETVTIVKVEVLKILSE